MIPLTQEEGAGLGAREAPGLLEDALQQGVQVALARERDADLDEFFQQLGAVEHGLHGSGDRNTIPPEPLSIVQRAIGSHNEIVGRGPVLGEAGHAEAHGDRPVTEGVLLHEGPHALGVGDRPGRRRVHQDDRELVAAVPGDHAEAPRVLEEEPRQVLEDLVARAVAEAVVDGLEVVHIEDRERHGLVEARVALEFLLHPYREVAPVVDVGERVLEREVFEPRVADGDRGLGRERPHEALVLGVEGHDAAPVLGIDQLEHAEDGAAGILHRDHEDGLRPVVQARVHARVEGIRAIRRNHIGVVQIQDVAGQRDVARQADLPQMQRLLLKAAPHLRLTELARQEVVLHDGELEQLTLTQEEGAGLGTCETPGLGEDPLEQGPEVSLTGQGDPDLDQLPERLGQVEGRRLRLSQHALPARTHPWPSDAQGTATRFRPCALALYIALSATATRSSPVVASSGRLATPRLTVTGPWAKSCRSMTWRMRSAYGTAPAFAVFTRSTANSSPP